MRILLVEDHPTHLKLAGAVLSAEGHSIISASAAEQALQHIATEPPEVTLLDMSLPGMDGFALVRRLKASALTRNIPIVAVTSYVEAYSEAEALRIGCSAYLTKPLDTRSLARHLTDAFLRGPMPASEPGPAP